MRELADSNLDEVWNEYDYFTSFPIFTFTAMDESYDLSSIFGTIMQIISEQSYEVRKTCHKRGRMEWYKTCAHLLPQFVWICK